MTKQKMRNLGENLIGIGAVLGTVVVLWLIAEGLDSITR